MKRYVLSVGHSDDAGLGGEGWVVRMSDHFSESDPTNQRWVKYEDAQELERLLAKWVSYMDLSGAMPVSGDLRDNPVLALLADSRKALGT